MFLASKDIGENLRHKPLLIAHRGDTVHFPENSLNAFNSAFLNGAGGVEMDIQLRDGEIIVVHNYTFPTDSNYPKLDEILSKIHNKGRLEIEIKAMNTEILPILKDRLKEYPEADIELTTSEVPLLPYVKAVFPKLKLGLILHNFIFQDWMSQELATNKIIGWTKMSQADIAHVPFSVLDRFGNADLVNNLHRSGLLVHTHIFKEFGEEKILSDVTKWGVDQCTIDNINLING